MGDGADDLNSLYEWDDGYDPDYDEPEMDFGGVRKRLKTCKYCGVEGFIWRETDKGWRLADPATGQIHTCK